MYSVQLIHVKEFVKSAKKKVEDFDEYDIGSLKEILRLAIDEFKINAKIEFDEEEEYEYIKLFRIEDEALLDKVLELAVNDGEECSISYVFEGNILREY
ncbi:DUF6407 family protein [Bacillus thuringiensis]|uniref:Uncharacterized protein n=1 Tax=Bacillus thuringiensis TaxID=1428 RepID=A0A9X6WF90_BACTU|nr:DUF6407 family protein [Bacillus thuringiensis]PFJ25050.1 hypothetical protein COJ15_36000 [Bacillus thuringiensis]